MDVAPLIAFLAPCLGFLLDTGKVAKERAAGKLGDEVWGHARRLWARLGPAVEARPAAAEANRQVKTLVHELSHALVRADRQDDDPELDAAAEELVAETVAYSVCASSGVEPGEFSISTWPAGASARRSRRSSAPRR